MSIDKFSYSVFGVSSYIIIIPILLFITLFVFGSLCRNFYIIYYPFLWAIWFTTIGSVSIWSNIFCGAKMELEELYKNLVK